MPSGPTLFDDGDGTDPDQAPTSQSLADRQHDDASTNRGRRPNYLIRRAVVVGGVVAVLATASVVVGQLIGSDSDDVASGAIGTDWNRVVLVDDRSGRVVVDDESGEELARIESGVRSPIASAVVDSTAVVVGAETVAVIDIGDETVDAVDIAADSLVTPSGSALTMVAARSDGGRALLVHGPSGDVIDTDAFAPVVGARYQFAEARSATSGRDVLVTDSGNFQSVLFSFDRDEPSYFPGLAIAVDAELVVTAQNVGSDATVNVFDHDGQPVATGRTSSVRAGMVTEAGVVLVTVEGAVVTMSSSDGEISGDTQLDIGTIESGVVTTSGDRLVVTGTDGTAIVSDTADAVASFPAQQPTGDGRPPTGSSCLATVDAGDSTSAQIAVVDFVDGAVLVEANGVEPVLTDSSGCVVGVSTDTGFDLLGREGVQQYPGDTLLAVSLDGTAVAAERDGRVVLVATASDDAPQDDPIDLGPRGRTVHFTQS